VKRKKDKKTEPSKKLIKKSDTKIIKDKAKKNKKNKKIN